MAGTSGKPKVAVAAAGSYERRIILAAVRRLMELAGPLEFPKPGQNVCLKPNLLMAADPSQAITTHPEVVRAVGTVCREAGARAYVADSPGSRKLWNADVLRKVYDRCGISALAGDGIGLNFRTDVRTASCPGGKLVRSFELIAAALEADVLISIAKAKTHSLTVITGALKNLFGLVPGLEKSAFHLRLRNIRNFSEMLVDLAGAASPSFTVVDAVVGMEGDGPTSGVPRRLGFLLASRDVHALDVVLAHVMGAAPMEVPTVAAAARRGLSTGSFADIEIVGDAHVLGPARGFVLPGTTARAGVGAAGRLVPLLRPLLEKLFVLVPEVVEGLCAGCGSCAEACPNRAVKVVGGKAQVNRTRCIRCYCCHEACPRGAIRLKGSVLRRIFHKPGR